MVCGIDLVYEDNWLWGTLDEIQLLLFWNLDVKESNDEFYTNDAEVRPIESLK